MKTFWSAARTTIVILVVALIFFLSYFIISSFLKDHSPQQAYDITGVADDGTTLISLSDYFGTKGTVLVFFDIDTGKAIDLLQQLSSLAPDYPVTIFAVATSRKPIEEQKNLLKEDGITLPVLAFDVQGEMAETYNVHGTPVTYFIDKNGAVQEAYIASVSTKSLIKSMKKIA